MRVNNCIGKFQIGDIVSSIDSPRHAKHVSDKVPFSFPLNSSTHECTPLRIFKMKDPPNVDAAIASFICE